MGSSWTLLTLFLVYSYPNERLGLLSRRLLALDLSRLARPRTSPKPLPKVSACSRPPLGLVYATPIERLYYAYATQNYRATLDIATIYLGYTNNIATIVQRYSYNIPTIAQHISFFITKALPLPSPYQRPCYDLPTTLLQNRQIRPIIK